MFMRVCNRRLYKILAQLLLVVLIHLGSNFQESKWFSKLELCKWPFSKSKMQNSQIIKIHLRVDLSAFLYGKIILLVLFLLKTRFMGGTISFLFWNIHALQSFEVILTQMLKLGFGMSQHTDVLLAGMLAQFWVILDWVLHYTLSVFISLF